MQTTEQSYSHVIGAVQCATELLTLYLRQILTDFVNTFTGTHCALWRIWKKKHRQIVRNIQPHWGLSQPSGLPPSYTNSNHNRIPIS